MNDYISRAKALLVLKIYSPSEFEERIAALPAADVREDSHAHWIKLDMHRGMEQYKCSSCQESCYVPECMGEPMYSYCPNCAAKMDGGDEA